VNFSKEEPVSTPFFYPAIKKLTPIIVISALLLFADTIRGQNYTLDVGKRLFDQEEYEQARDVLVKVVETEPNNPEANFLLCKVFLILDDHDRSIEYGEKAVKLDGSVSNYHLWLGRAYGVQAQKGSKLKAIFRAKNVKGNTRRRSSWILPM
jgi:tetratricopeptide (TPR) repeat protein